MSHKAKNPPQQKTTASHQNFPLQGAGKPQQKAAPAEAAGKSKNDGHKTPKGAR